MQKLRKHFLIGLITSLSISALIAIALFIIGDLGETQFRILLTTLAIGTFSLTGLCCATLYDRAKSTFAFLGMILSGFALLCAFFVIWEGYFVIPSSGTPVRLLLTSIVLAVASAHACLLLLITPNKTTKIALYATLAAIGAVTLMLQPLIWGYPGSEDIYWRILGVVAVLDVLGTIVTPVLHKLNT